MTLCRIYFGKDHDRFEIFARVVLQFESACTFQDTTRRTIFAIIQSLQGTGDGPCGGRIVFLAGLFSGSRDKGQANHLSAIGLWLWLLLLLVIIPKTKGLRKGCLDGMLNRRGRLSSQIKGGRLHARANAQGHATQIGFIIVIIHGCECFVVLLIIHFDRSPTIESCEP